MRRRRSAAKTVTKRVGRRGETRSETDPASGVQALRASFGMSRSRFARLTGYSERALADWESLKRSPDASTQRRLREHERLRAAIGRIIAAEAMGEWFDSPNRAFGHLNPIEVIERGEMDRLWRMVHELGAGDPS